MRLDLAFKPTPVQHLKRLSKEYGFELYVKRDDLTELVGSGNKIRKLEYLFADALRKGATTILTCGGVQSNHARATAYVARRFGLRVVLFLRRGGEKESGNYLLDRLLGAEIVEVTEEEYEKIDEVFEEYKGILERKGERVYVIPEGGSNSLGALGYFNAVLELNEQQNLEEFDAVVCAVGSGGTLAGLVAGLSFLGLKLKVLGVNVTKRPASFFVEKVKELVSGMKEYGLQLNVSELNFEVTDEFQGPAYAVPSDEDIAIIKEVATKEALILDPVYTAKAFRGMLQTYENSGKKVLFVHTGGLFGIFAQAGRLI